MLSVRLSRFLAVLLVGSLGISCAIGPRYSPELEREESGLNERHRKVVVTKFYKAKSELSYLGDLDISIILETAKLSDISFRMASHLNRSGVEAIAMKDAAVGSLKSGETMLTGSIITRSIPMEENFPVPGMMVVLLIGNILPNPIPFISGVDVMYRYELVDSSGRILFTSPEKSSRISYRDHWIWGRIFNYQRYEKKITEDLDERIFDLIVEDLFE